MRSAAGHARELGAAFVEFWVAPSRGSAVALFRIGYGLLAIWTAVGVLLNLERYYGDSGMVPWEAVAKFPEQRYSVLSLAPQSDALLLAVALAFLSGAVLLTLGAWPRFGAFLVFATNVALQHRNPYVLNGGDRLFVILAGLALLLPLGARWSVDAWRRARSGAPPPHSTVWAQRLIALELSYIYLSSCFAKLRYEGWREGYAVAEVMSSPVFAEWPTRLDFFPVVAFLTWSTLAIELLLPLVVWDRKLRPYALVAGVMFHLGIEVTMTIPMFSAIMIVSYACFLTDDEAERLVSQLGLVARRVAPRWFGAAEAAATRGGAVTELKP